MPSVLQGFQNLHHLYGTGKGKIPDGLAQDTHFLEASQEPRTCDAFSGKKKADSIPFLHVAQLWMRHTLQ